MPSIKAIEQAEFGGVDSRSNPINMPQKRWLVCRNWIPRPDGHLELREGYTIRAYNQTGGGAAYSLTPYSVAVPDSYLHPPPPLQAFSPVTGFPPPISQLLANGTRCALYWQKSPDSHATANVKNVTCTISAAGVPIVAIYQVDSTARFLLGHYVTVAGVISNASTPANFFNGNFQIIAIGSGTITLLLGTSQRLFPAPRLLPLPPPIPPPLPSPTAAFTVSPTSISFGNVSANVAATIPVTLRFTTSAVTGVGTINNATLSNADFTVTSPSPFPIGGLSNNQTVTLQVHVNKALTGSYSAILTLATSTQTFTIPVSATVVGSDLSVVPPQVVFPNTTVGVTSSGHPGVVITNNSNATITLSNPTFSNPDFAFMQGNAFTSLSIGPGQQAGFQLTATPSVAGTDTGTLTITTSDPAFPHISISLEVVATSAGGSGYPENYAGSGGTITAAEVTPGPPIPLLMPLTSAAGGVFTPGSSDPLKQTFPMKGMPILSTAPWHYAQGKDGYLYMTNGIDFKFFDGVCFRDVGLPILTAAQLQSVQVAIGFEGPSSTDSANVGLNWSHGSGTLPSWLPVAYYYAFFDPTTNLLVPGLNPLGNSTGAPGGNNNTLNLTGLPVSTNPNAVGLLARNLNGGPGAVFLTEHSANLGTPVELNVTMSGSGSTVTGTMLSGSHGLSTGSIIAIDNYQSTPWPSSGPFAVTVLNSNSFTFQAPTGVDASVYDTSSVVIRQLLSVPPGGTTVTILQDWPLSFSQGVTVSSTTGGLQLPFLNHIATTLLPASTIGGAQPGYQFYAAIYNPLTGHVGNRVPIGTRINNTSDCTIAISGLPDFTAASAEIQSFQQLQNGGKIPTILLPTSDPEWRILIGRTGDGGEVPYACIDANGAWMATTAPDQMSLNVSTGQIDSNSELPFNNFPPPRSHLIPPTQESFAIFWREGDRMCGVLKDSPFVYRSASELDATTGIFVGDPAQAWDPSKLETFPTAENIIGGYSTLQESWVYTRDDMAQLSELSGEVAWNGPYNWGLVGPFALTSGWNALSFWVSHDRQLCTMLPGGDGPISISTEYERALLSRIGDEQDAAGNPLGYMSKTEVIYFRDPVRLIDCLRIKCVDNEGKPFTVIHDFNLRDDASPYGQGYEEDYLGPLAIDYQSAFIRDSMARARVWATASDGALYQFYSGGLDNTDYYDGTKGDAFTADAIGLRYLGGERTVARTLEWYGDDQIRWFVFENTLNVLPDENYWVNLTFQMRPFPGDAQAAHYIADLQRPELIHVYLWAQLTAHPADALIPSTPMAFSDPPHIPLEVYGRLYMCAPWLGTSRGR